MSSDQVSENKPLSNSMLTCIKWIVILFMILVFGLASGLLNPFVFLFEFLFLILLGWIKFLIRVVPAITWDWESIAMGVGSFALLTILLHSLCCWLYQEQHSQNSDPESITVAQPWRKRWTGAILGLTLLLFTTGIAIVGFVHQVVWLYRK